MVGKGARRAAADAAAWHDYATQVLRALGDAAAVRRRSPRGERRSPCRMLARSFVALLTVDAGYEPEDVLVTRISPPPGEYDTDERRRVFWAELVRRVSSISGVQAAGAVRKLPLASTLGDLSIQIEGRDVREGDVSPRNDWQAITPGYFDAIGMRILRGRGITDRDHESAPGAVVLNESAARLHFPAGDAIGKRFLLGGGAGPGWVTVVGIVNDVRHTALGAPPTPEMYLAHRQFRFWDGGAAVATMSWSSAHRHWC